MKRFAPNVSEIYFAGARLSRRGGEISISLSYSAARGMGERFDAVNQKGRRVINQVREKFCFQGEESYCPAPFFWTDNGFGFYADTAQTTVFDFRESEIIVELPENADIVLFSGTPYEMIGEYMSLFGKALLPPDWVFGVWVSANRWNSQSDVEQLLHKLKEYDFPASVLVLEAWSDEATFYIWNGAKYPQKAGALSLEDFDFSASPWPEPKAMVDSIHSAGLRLLLWQAPVYKRLGEGEAPNARHTRDCEAAVRERLCVMLPSGMPYTIPEGKWFPGSMVPDFTNPATVKSWFDNRRYLLDMGVDGFKTDGGEFIHSAEAVFFDGSRGAEGLNRYSMDYTRSYRDFVGPQRVIFSRAGFSGQHTVPCHWAGDQQSVNSELKSVLRAGLSAACSGIIFWGFDIGGFAGALPSPDLYRRATQLACFCPIMQWHSEPDGGQFRELMPGAEGNNERSPWNMEAAFACPGFAEEMRFWHRLRQRLRPYLEKTAEQCVEQSKPMLRPLVLEWPEDKIAAACEDEFMLGEDILVAPLLEENAQSRRVYLPRGRWRGLFDGREYEGACFYTAGEPGRLPVFTRNGFSLDE